MKKYDPAPRGNPRRVHEAVDAPSHAEAIEIVPLGSDFDFEESFTSERPVREEAWPQAIDAAGVGAGAAGTTVSVADLLENNVRLDWKEALAIAQRLCQTMAQDPAANVQRSAVEPWNIEITEVGSVLVVPGGASTDPLVQQVGRVLRSLLTECPAPAELRLIAAQASFDVPVFSSVEELSVALSRFDLSANTEAIRAAFHKGVEAKFSMAAAEPVMARIAAPAPQTPRLVNDAPVIIGTAQTSRSRRGWTLAFAFAAVLAASAVWSSMRLGPVTIDAPRALTQAPPLDSRVQRPPTPVPVAPRPADAAATPVGSLPGKSPRSARAERIERTDTPRSARKADTGRDSSSTREALAAEPPSAAATVRHDVAGGDEQRALALLAAGRHDDAAIVFDSIVLRDPRYQLSASIATPEARAVLRRSKQTLLPTLARTHYETARRALDAGDYPRAIFEAENAATLLGDPDLLAAPADLRAAVARLRTSAMAARASQEERIYTMADADVIPPAPLGRQLPALPPPGLNSLTTGRLEILIDRSGGVEAVRLHTPLNAYHDRMIVSAAKAWHYKPALRNGKPVRFNLVLSINLPESH